MKKIIASVLVCCMLFGVCSCRKKQQPTISSSSETSEDDVSDPDGTGITIEIPNTSYTGTFSAESTAPEGSLYTPHTYYSGNEVMTVLYSIASLKNGDSSEAWYQRVDGYCESSPVVGARISIPDKASPIRSKGDQTLEFNDGSYVIVDLVIYDQSTVDELYALVSDYYRQMFGTIITENPDFFPRGELLMYVAGEPSSSVWKDSCYMSVEILSQEEYGYDSMYVTVCMPIIYK